MRLLLNAGFGSPLSDEDWDLILGLGWQGIRQDVPSVVDAPTLVYDVARRRPHAYGIFVVPAKVGQEEETIRTAEAVELAISAAGMQEYGVLEVGNEPDLAGWDPRAFGRLVARVAEQAPTYLPVVSGGVGSLSPKAMDWLRVAVEEMPPRVGIGFHPYRDKGPLVARPGYSSRKAENDRLRNVAPGRELWCTEVGWHQAPRPKPFPLCFVKEQWSEGEVAAFVREEMRIQYQLGSQCCVVYQLNDGPSRTWDQDNFGIRAFDGSLKQAAYVAREWNS